MPNHLFVNSRHYQDRPDSTMRYRIASHAARHGPNVCTTSKSPPLGMDEMTEELTAESGTRDTQSSSRGIMSSPEVQLAPVVLATSWDNVVFPQDYGETLVRCSALCICSEGSSKRPPRSLEGNRGHTGDCLIPDKWFTVVKEHELPFRVTDFFRRSVKWTLFDPMHGGLVIQCLLMVGQAALDSLNPKFGFEPSDQALRLQHKALRAMQRVITMRHDMIDDNIVIASALMLLIAGFYADQDAYRAHYSSLQKLIELRGGFNRTRAYAVVKDLMISSEIFLAYHRYRSIEAPGSATGRDSIAISTQLLSQAPVKLRYQMQPFPIEITNMIKGMSLGFQVLARSSRLSVQTMRLLHLVCQWSAYIEQPIESNAENGHLLADTPHAITCQRSLCDESIQTKRMAVLLLISLPLNTPDANLERCLCLGFLNLLHSVTLLPHPMPLRDLLVSNFVDAITSLTAEDWNEEDFVIWLALSVASEWRYCAAKLELSPLLPLHGYNAPELCQKWLDKSKQLMDWLLIKYERAADWDAIQRICSRFLWLRRLGVEWKATWKDALKRQSWNTSRTKT